MTSAIRLWIFWSGISRGFDRYGLNRRQALVVLTGIQANSLTLENAS
jgi:hypothetical protein